MSRGSPGNRAAGRGRPPFRRRRKLLDLVLALAVLALVAVAAAYLPGLRPARTLEGAARVADGDSLTIAGERVRLQGIDAPELAQLCARGDGDYPCGREAREALARLVAAGAVSCESGRRDRYDRVLARCRAGRVDLNRAMVEAGWAVSYGDYRDAEDAARRAGKGLWAGSFDRPQDWRRSHGEPAEDSHDGVLPLIDWLRRLLRW